MPAVQICTWTTRVLARGPHAGLTLACEDARTYWNLVDSGKLDKARELLTDDTGVRTNGK